VNIVQHESQRQVLLFSRLAVEHFCCFPLFNMKLTGNFLLLCFEISLHGILKSDGLSVYRCKLIEGDQFCWCAMIVGYGMLGNSAGSIDFFTEMLKDGVHPNDVAFTSILSTCSHTGMVTAWKKYFHSMAQHFNITPSTKHYACVVHVLARAGNLEQVLEFIYKKFKVGADVISCCSFLFQLFAHEISMLKHVEYDGE